MFENLKLSRPLAVLDLETTGTDPSRDRIVELAVVRCCPGGKQRTVSLRIHPGVPILASATKVHGITDADVAACPSFARIAPRLARLLEGCDLAGFGVKRFDVPLLAAKFTRAGVPFRVAHRRIIDAMQIFHSLEPRNLNAAHRRYLGVELAGAHGARKDALAAARVLEAMLGAHSELPRTVSALHREFADPDVAGRFRREEEGIVFAFGKHRDKPIGEVAHEDPAYLRWMLKADFLDDVKSRVREALRLAGHHI